LCSVAGAALPQVFSQSNGRATLISYHFRRGGGAATNAMLANVKALNEVTGPIQPIGTIWSDSASKSKDFVLFIMRSPYTNGTRFPDTAGGVQFFQAAFA